MMSQSSMLTAQSGPISMSLVARSAHATAADISKPAAQAHDHHRPRPKTLNPNLKGDSAPEPPLLRSGAMGPTRSCQDERGGRGSSFVGLVGADRDLERTGVGLDVFLVGRAGQSQTGLGLGLARWGRRENAGGRVDFFRRECEGLQF